MDEKEKQTLTNLAQKVDRILKEELLKAKIECLDSEVRIYDIKTVGVQGDSQTYCYPAEIELKQRQNFIWNPDFLERLSSRITNEVRDINRVLYVLRY